MRKKLPLISGILNVLEKLKGNTGIIENTSVATHTIAAGKYVIWKNDLYKASSAISIGDTLSLSNLTAVSDGIANELNSKINDRERITLVDSGNGNGAFIDICGNIATFSICNTSLTSIGTIPTQYLPKGVGPNSRFAFPILSYNGSGNNQRIASIEINCSTGAASAWNAEAYFNGSVTWIIDN